ncbi:MAG: zinc ribbon domain-containing protein [Nitrospira sp.]|nr:zinc ribbon domain-containing protein [Nitrospira sp.]
MPIYEYRCKDCGKRSSHLVLNINNPAPAACPHCRSARLDRIMSRFAAPKSEEARMESLADPSKFGDLDENDPRSMARFMKKMGQEMGEDLGDDFDEALEGAGDDLGQTAPGMAESTSTDLD